MKTPHRIPTRSLSLGAALLLLAGLATAADVRLSGDHEVPPLKTMASGTSTIAVAADGALLGSVKTSGIAGTAAHIHQGAMGKNGPVLIPLSQSADGEWSLPAGARLSAEQLKSFKAGELYVNVHSEAHKGGEIRAQLMP